MGVRSTEVEVNGQPTDWIAEQPWEAAVMEGSMVAAAVDHSRMQYALIEAQLGALDVAILGYVMQALREETEKDEIKRVLRETFSQLKNASEDLLNAIIYIAEETNIYEDVMPYEDEI